MRFDCSCCGVRFDDTKENQAKHDQDKGCGFCPACEAKLTEENENEWKKLEALCANALSEGNRKTFWELEMEVRRGIILQAIEEDVITYKIGGKHESQKQGARGTKEDSLGVG